ncbi:MAG: hypothetical protein O3A45_02410 [Proteobacteria bacterium]|nr:hypothetical protein [Pseudomonadota bacterium]
MEHKETEPEFKDLTSKGFMAIFYINDLLDHRYKIHQIIKLFSKDFHELIKEVFQSRLKFSKNNQGRKRFVWDKLNIFVKSVEIYNEKIVNDTDYFETYYPIRKYSQRVCCSV